ncbi:MAG: hypothetical protein ABI132_10070 [Rhodanobacteraceae bacterium]
MQYRDGTEVMLDDTVSVPVPKGSALARVVMLGDSRAHLEIDARFLELVEVENWLGETEAIVEWLDENPFAHDSPKYAPVGRYMCTPMDEFVELKGRTRI